MTQRRSRKNIYHATTYLAAVFLLLIVFISGSWFLLLREPAVQPNTTEALEELRASRDAWENRRPQSFRYLVDRTCSCPDEYSEPYVATEERGRRSAAFRSHVETRSAENLTGPPEPVWIENLFAIAERAMLDGKEADVDFDARFGFPRSVELGTGDAYNVRDFEVLEYD